MSKLLPTNSTKLEKDIVESFHYVVKNKDILIKKIWNVQECPSEFLVYLAYFVGVDFDIYNDLDDAQKRDYITKSIDIYRHKGTLGALRKALSVTGYTINIIEWYQDASTAHTAKVRVASPTATIDVNLVLKIIKKTKNVQTVIQVSVVIDSQANIFRSIAQRLKIKQVFSNFTATPVYTNNIYKSLAYQMRIKHK
ncbi:phage tail protein I [Francisella philomiragia]|uniref:Phage tail protein I n=1 Tax=Francisella philomiragia TaxID=28110 RepID=A0ABS1GD42_9GAMM|nr:phage tail protein I [Francisella philomiragia]MBK2258995.1 phage tail protein I [Francisella philomiragia]MBK2302686.1 phage tail protein I [Francisella philomiragia]